MNTIQMILENNLFRGIIGIIFLIGLCYFLSTDKKYFLETCNYWYLNSTYNCIWGI